MLVRGHVIHFLREVGLVYNQLRDVALAHVKAMELEEAPSKRFFVTAGFCRNAGLVKIIWDSFSEPRDKLPDENHWGGEPNPNMQCFGYDTSRAMRILGMTWTPYENPVVDSVKSLIKEE
ncbi:hypothetical protein BGZ61DRAFT_484828 [Ilyonectria robusta]|uniref:uncharacterized protein n=1 Tax=Ilyonectria robusta TaxID=1079257 RepID=UPI001E8CFC1B|nr:uncharacterized protein BGZ61DRAFT_484828 [Ilyonectria robusta]KAH8663764.1 hypothetical protein BGZ61DRAFT_484828 [Ilyonectria robusta]